MYPRVTAVVVAHNGAAHLERTLDALRAQTRQPDAVVAVDGRSRDKTAALLAAYGPTHLIQLDEQLSFGQAVARGLRVVQEPSGDDEWLWLIAQDSAPEPGALAALLGAVEVAPSVAVAGPKQMDWLRPDYIRGYGESVTRYGATVELVQDELDQGQHDSETDVLAVAAGGLLVRHTLWEELGGFDPGLPVVDDALDFCIRTRLAGHRVVRVPDARVSTAKIGIEGTDGRRSGRSERRRARRARTAQLHRRLAYAAAPLVLIHWLALVPIALGRSVLRLLRKQPGLVGGEIIAALVVAFGGTKVLRARRRLHTSKNVGWAAISTLRIPFDQVRQLRSTRHDAVRVTGSRERIPIRFFGGGGVWVVLVALAVSLVLYAPLIPASGVGGGGLLPLSNSVATLWQNAAYGWRDIGVGFAGGADPFAAVLAVLGTLTFWSPSFSLVLLYLGAIPLAAMGAWFMAARITGRTWIRVAAALLYIASPSLHVALAEGRVGALIAHILLPWLFFAGFGAYRSWSAAATSSLLAAAVVASAPSLAPALLLIWVVVVAVSGRRIGRYLGMPIPALALALPLILAHAENGSLLSLLADPGVPIASARADVAQLLAGLPGSAISAWTPVVTGLGISADLTVLAPLVLLIPLALLVVGSLATRRNLQALGGVAVVVLGFATAVGAQQLTLSTSGSTEVAVWAGSGLSLYWMGAVLCGVLTLSRMPALKLVAGLVAVGAATAAVVPLAIAFPADTAQVSAAATRSVPAYVAAEAATEPRVGTLVITPQPDGGIVAEIVRGEGATLDARSTLVSTGVIQDQTVSTAAANLASRSGLDVSDQLATLGVRFVLLSPAATVEAGAATDAANQVRSRAAVALDGNAELAPVGDTQFGLLWSFEPGDQQIAVVDRPADVAGPFGRLYQVGVLVVFIVALLLALPTGLSLERHRSNSAVAGIDDEPTEATGQYDDGGDDV